MKPKISEYEPIYYPRIIAVNRAGEVCEPQELSPSYDNVSLGEIALDASVGDCTNFQYKDGTVVLRVTELSGAVLFDQFMISPFAKPGITMAVKTRFPLEGNQNARPSINAVSDDIYTGSTGHKHKYKLPIPRSRLQLFMMSEN